MRDFNAVNINGTAKVDGLHPASNNVAEYVFCTDYQRCMCYKKQNAGILANTCVLKNFRMKNLSLLEPFLWHHVDKPTKRMIHSSLRLISVVS
jgi:hypothetical protein